MDEKATAALYGLLAVIATRLFDFLLGWNQRRRDGNKAIREERRDLLAEVTELWRWKDQREEHDRLRDERYDELRQRYETVLAERDQALEERDKAYKRIEELEIRVKALEAKTNE